MADEKMTLQEAFNQACIDGDIEIARRLIKIKGVDINYINDTSLTSLLCIAISYGHLDIVELLIANDVDVHQCSDMDWSPLHYDVCSQKGSEVTRMLINAGTNIDHMNNFGSTPLMIASDHGCIEHARLLLEAGADIHLKNNKGETAMDIASRENNPKLMALLDEHIKKSEVKTLRKRVTELEAKLSEIRKIVE